MTINDLSFAARGAIFKVYSTLGPGYQNFRNGKRRQVVLKKKSV
jgi:hypothetical protein